MSVPTRSTSPQKSDPTSFFRSLLVVATISIMVTMVVSTYGFYTVLARYITTNAEDDAVQLSRALLEQEKRLLHLSENGTIKLHVDPQIFPALDESLRRFLQPFGIIKIKIYANNKKIIYSTDRGIIGEIDHSNKRLARALAGSNDSLLVKKEEVLDLADEKKFDVDVVETYVPIKDNVGRIIGSFEIYVDVTKYKAGLNKVVVTASTMLLVVLVTVFMCSLVVIKKLTDQLKKAHAELEKMAITDELTGIFNRRHILNKSNEFRTSGYAAKRDPRETIGVLIIDVDHFKNVNDTYGHMIGDEVLKELSRRLSESCRDYDLAGRLGGEEFIMVLPHTALPEIISIAKRIHRSIGDQPFQVPDNQLSITVSIGVACTHPNEDDLGSALKRADDGLYRAKHNGRNRIEVVE